MHIVRGSAVLMLLINVCTPWAIKRNQLVFVCDFVKNQHILMQFSLLDFTRAQQ